MGIKIKNFAINNIYIYGMMHASTQGQQKPYQPPFIVRGGVVLDDGGDISKGKDIDLENLKD